MKNIIIGLIVVMLFFVLPVKSQTYNSLTAGISQLSLMKKYKDVSWRKITLNKMRTQTENLSKEDKNVIKKYVYGAVTGENTFLLMNCYLRGNLQDYIPKKDVTKPLKFRMKFYAESLETAVLKIKLPQNMLLYEGIDEKTMKLIFGTVNKDVNNVISKPVTEENCELLAKYLHNVKFLEKGFMLTSYDKDCAKKTKFRFEVRAPKNLQAALIEDIGKKENKEVIINCGYKWNVVSVTKESDRNTKGDYYKIVVKMIL